MLLADVLGNRGPTGPKEAVAADDEVASDFLFLSIPAKAYSPCVEIEVGTPAEADLRLRGVEILQAYSSRLEDYLPTGVEPGGVEVFDDLLLAIDHDVAPGKIGEVDAVAAPAEAQLDPLVDGPLAVHPLSDARLPQESRRLVLEHTGTDRRLHLLAAAQLEHDRLDALQVQQVREQRPRRSTSDDPNLCSHARSSSLTRKNLPVPYQNRAQPGLRSE